MDSPAPEDQTVSTKSIQDHMTDQTGSEKSHLRIPTPPGTIDIPDDITDDDAIFYEDEFGEDDLSEYDDGRSPFMLFLSSLRSSTSLIFFFSRSLFTRRPFSQSHFTSQFLGKR